RPAPRRRLRSRRRRGRPSGAGSSASRNRAECGGSRRRRGRRPRRDGSCEYLLEAWLVADRREVVVGAGELPQLRLGRERRTEVPERLVGATGQALAAGEVEERPRIAGVQAKA